jgi:hypothetical protein
MLNLKITILNFLFGSFENLVLIWLFHHKYIVEVDLGAFKIQRDAHFVCERFSVWYGTSTYCFQKCNLDFS